jgi:hypothetical protein
MHRSSLIVLAAVALPLTIGCTFKPHGYTGGTGGGLGPEGSGGNAWAGLDAVVSTLPDAPREYVSATDGASDSGPSGDANCQNQPFSVLAPPPDLLIVLDRSGSMAQDVTGSNCQGMGGRGGGGRGSNCGATSKWSQVTTAINSVVAMTETKINWGIKFFGNDMTCGVTAGATVPPAPMNAQAIADAIAAPANQPGSSTPTAAGVLSAGEYLTTLSQTDTNPKFILLATDGQPNCAAGVSNTTDDMGAIDSVTTVKTMGFSTFVIGIATAGGAGDATLSSMAMNGGYPLMGGATQYYSIMNSADLIAALGAIQTVTMGMCTYPLGTPGDQADMNKVSVTVDGVPSPKDDANGWHYDPGMKSITFTGTTCDQLMAGTLKNVQVLYGCKIVVI